MALNDPQWGKRGNDGPPDLDEILRKFNQKLNGLFGGKGGSNDGPPRGPAPAMMGGGIAIGAGIVIAIWLASGFYVVEQGSKGVELTLGRYSGTTEAGLKWRWPYPIGDVRVVNVDQVRAVEVGHRNNQKQKVTQESLMLTEDQNIVDVQFAVQYTLASAEDYLFNNVSPDEAVRQVAETSMREIVGKSKMDFVLYEGRGQIAANAKTMMQRILERYKTGILISSVTLQNAQPPEQVQDSFNDAERARQDQVRLRNEGEAYANDVLPKARGLAARLMEEANGHKERVIANAEGDAARFRQVLVEYEKAPQVTRERMYLDMMQQVMTSTSKVLVDQKGGGGNLLYLPLDKLMQMSGQGAPSDTAAAMFNPKPAEAAPQAAPEASRAQQLRSRDSR
ncbi:MAG: FtsH protease activity modulator HflK [Burkholderiales bacterium]|nr:FtsH protease activity modulator HflK [Burkholderiales bacterium]